MQYFSNALPVGAPSKPLQTLPNLKQNDLYMGFEMSHMGNSIEKNSASAIY
jgi:hypothetical protein